MKRRCESIAPARANLLGEHTDYNFGYVLPTPLSYKTKITVEAEESSTGQISMRSTAFDEEYTSSIGESKKDLWTDYVCGCINILADEGHKIPDISIKVDSDIPMGMGLSSSAALTVATLRAMRELLEIRTTDEEIANLAHRVESEYVGVPCGVMDQMVCSVGRPGHALFLDTKTMSMENIPLPDTHKFCILHSGIKHKLKDGDGGYRQRVSECNEACSRLGVESLRDVTEDMLEDVEKLPDTVKRRVLHVHSENKRVLDGVNALKNNEMEEYGKLMVESHLSQKDNYDVSVPKIDKIVEIAMEKGATGARLTGGGFGGSVIAMVEKDKVEEWWKKVSSEIDGVTLM